MSKKWPAKSQWIQFFKTLTKKEKTTFFAFFLLFLFSFSFLLLNFYFKNTEKVPAKGGTFIEGVIGQPRFINPVYANSDVDRDLVQLIFSGLMKYDENLNIVPDLAERYEIEQEGRVYKFYLKENLLWQDKTPLTADDVVFTIRTIQNPDFKSPLQANWVGIEVEKINELEIKFTLKKPYGAFIENCILGILPKHIWQNASSENFAFEPFNLEPIGSGPYKLKKIKQNGSNQIKSLILTQNPLYHAKKPYISKIEFLFFANEEELIKAARKKKIKGLSLTSSTDLGKKWQNYSLLLPRYFAVFFNQENSEVLKEKEVRLALNYGTNKKEISQKIVDSPILPGIYGFEPSLQYEFDIEKAKSILEEAGFKDEDGNGLREKIITKEPAFKFTSNLAKGSKGKEVTELQKCLEGEVTGYFGPQTEQLVIEFQEKYIGETTGTLGLKTRAKLNEICFEEPDEVLALKFSLVTVNQPQMVENAELLKEQWRALGAEVEIETYSLFQLEQDFIKPRNYESLLFGEVLGAIPDPFPFWHSSQKKDPGLNLALYENSEADKLLEENRKTSDPEIRAEKLVLFQDVLIEDVPCVFIYSPDFVYAVSKEIKGVEIKKITDPSRRFIGIENWYIKTKRAWK
ncbi:peptidoglycan-binding protein [Patescibacteria group bacterium]|nr:peptidoglycan-binding protein [Patescibacteria group bacterium]